VGAVYVLCVYVEFLYGVEVGAFLVVVQYLHDVMDGAERVSFFEEVLPGS
jgi:hypothetical protein